MSAESFVCVSGVRSESELLGVARARVNAGFARRTAVGYQVSHKSIHRGTQTARQPLVRDLGKLISYTRSLGLWPAIHYYTKNNNTILEDVERLEGLGLNPRNVLFQFNTQPANPAVLNFVGQKGFETIFKVAVADRDSGDVPVVWRGDETVDVSSGNANVLAEQVLRVKDCIDYVMFDCTNGSSGKGLDLRDEGLAVRFGRQISNLGELDDVGLVYAGGITPENVRGIYGRLLDLFPGRASIDIESGVRTDDNRPDFGKVQEYFEVCKGVLEGKV